MVDGGDVVGDWGGVLDVVEGVTVSVTLVVGVGVPDPLGGEVDVVGLSGGRGVGVEGPIPSGGPGTWDSLSPPVTVCDLSSEIGMAQWGLVSGTLVPGR
ncbi:hypothetical protein NicSoilB8_05470 [Arthrobacter sp. NicSoilB8]|nr:hypothetical protein NicSoilB8_05470 [Arthrobacter sp. NicSoilB8]